MYHVSVPEASAALRKEHADQQVGTGGKGRGRTSLPALAWDAPGPLPQLPASRGEAGSDPDGDADDGDRVCGKAGRELCQLLLILCSMVRQANLSWHIFALCLISIKLQTAILLTICCINLLENL